MRISEIIAALTDCKCYKGLKINKDDWNRISLDKIGIFKKNTGSFSVYFSMNYTNISDVCSSMDKLYEGKETAQGAFVLQNFDIIRLDTMSVSRCMFAKELIKAVIREEHNVPSIPRIKRLQPD